MAGKQAKILTDEQIFRLLNFTNTQRHPQRNRVIALLSIRAGLRAGEIGKLHASLRARSRPSSSRQVATGRVASTLSRRHQPGHTCQSAQARPAKHYCARSFTWISVNEPATLADLAAGSGETLSPSTGDRRRRPRDRVKGWQRPLMHR